MGKFDGYITGKELDVNMKSFIKEQGKELFNDIQQRKNTLLTEEVYV